MFIQVLLRLIHALQRVLLLQRWLATKRGLSLKCRFFSFETQVALKLFVKLGWFERIESLLEFLNSLSEHGDIVLFVRELVRPAGVV